MEIQVTYSKELFRNAARAYTFSRLFYLAFFFFGFLLLYHLISGNLISIFTSPLALAINIICFGVFSLITYISTLINCKKSYKKLGPNPLFTFQFNDNGISVQSELTQSEIQWPFFHHLRRTKKLWLLFISKHQFLFLPTSQLSPDLQTFIITRLRENGVRIN